MQCKSGLGNNMVSRRNHLLYIFHKQFTSTSPVFTRQNTFEKKLARGMPIEQIFELRGSGPPGRICVPITGCFHDKTKLFKENLRVNCYLPLKYCRRQCTLLPPTWAKSHTKFDTKTQHFKHVSDLNCKPKEN